MQATQQTAQWPKPSCNKNACVERNTCSFPSEMTNVHRRIFRKSQNHCATTLCNLFLRIVHARHALFPTGKCSSTAPLAGFPNLGITAALSAASRVSLVFQPDDGRCTVWRHLNHHILSRRCSENMDSLWFIYMLSDQSTCIFQI